MDKNTDEKKFTITDEKSNIIDASNIMKVLGLYINKDNNMVAHLSILMLNITMTHNNIRVRLPYFTDHHKRIIINANIRNEQILLFHC